MALTVKTDSYLSVADADQYWSDRNNSTWSAATTANKEKALREATQYLDGAFTFIGEITDTDQALAWPRAGVRVLRGNFKHKFVDSTTIPQKIEHATAELALEALSERLKPSLSRGGMTKREKVDVIEIEYLDFAPSGKTFEFVSMLVRPFTMGSKSQVNLIRS